MDGSARSIDYEYDPRGNRTKMTASSGHSLIYVPDAADRVWQIKETGANPNIVAQLVYDVEGRRESLALGSAGTVGALSSSMAYGYDGIGRLSSITRELGGTSSDQVLTFAYSPASQIVERTNSNNAYASNSALNVSRDYARNGLNQYTATTSNGAPSATFAYDLNGNLQSDGSTSFVYDAENRLVSASGAKTATLAYDPLGRLWQVSGGPAGTTRFVYDGESLLEEYDGATGIRQRAYAHGPGTDEPLIWYQLTGGGPQRRLLHADHQGSIVAVADDNGSAIAINAYDAWGIPNAANLGRFQFTGQAWIPELGMYYYKARFYSPTLGRFMQTDPIGYEGGMNLYAYVNNDPINNIDPTGLADLNLMGWPGERNTMDGVDLPRTYTIGAHWNGYVHRIDDQRNTRQTHKNNTDDPTYSPRQLYNLARNNRGNPYVPGTQTFLASCVSGFGRNSYAQQYADISRGPVIASNSLTHFEPQPDGTRIMDAGRGAFYRFLPGGTTGTFYANRIVYNPATGRADRYMIATGSRLGQRWIGSECLDQSRCGRPK